MPVGYLNSNPWQKLNDLFAISRHFCIFADESDSPCRLRQQAARFFLSEHEINNKRRNETMDENELRETLARLEAAGWEPTPSRKTPEKLPKNSRKLPEKRQKLPKNSPLGAKLYGKLPKTLRRWKFFSIAFFIAVPLHRHSRQK